MRPLFWDVVNLIFAWGSSLSSFFCRMQLCPLKSGSSRSSYHEWGIQSLSEEAYDSYAEPRRSFGRKIDPFHSEIEQSVHNVKRPQVAAKES